jgi:NAD(P)-dependent dehydrogenase (short-subunit alcohol dehydrogenase family)
MKRQRGGQIINIASGAGRNGIEHGRLLCVEIWPDWLYRVTGSRGPTLGYPGRGAPCLVPSRRTSRRVANRLAVGEAGRRTPGEPRYALTPAEVASVILSMLLAAATGPDE